MRYWLVMPAAGSGRRFGAGVPKQYARLCGRTVIEWALSPFIQDARCMGIVIALAAGDEHWPRMGAALPRITAVAGGARRSESVRAGLAALGARAAAADWVLVHDAARPCLGASDLESLLSRLQHDAVGGLLAAPATDTLKRAAPAAAAADPAGPDRLPRVEASAQRGGLWRALTPQMFRCGALCRALDAAHAAGRYPTDEAQAIEWQGERPALVAGSSANIKVTTAADLLLAEAILAARQHEENS